MSYNLVLHLSQDELELIYSISSWLLWNSSGERGIWARNLHERISKQYTLTYRKLTGSYLYLRKENIL